MDGNGYFPGHLSHCRQRLFGCDQTRSKRTSEGLQGGLAWNLLPLGLLFALLVGFIALEVWSNFDKAKTAVTTEASALRAVVVLARVFPEEESRRIYTLIKRHIDKSWNKEWPENAQQRANFSTLPTDLIEALHDTLALKPADDSQRAAQSKMAIALYTALDAGRQLIAISEPAVGTVKWMAICFRDFAPWSPLPSFTAKNGRACAITLMLFCHTALPCPCSSLAAYSHPFTSVGPELLKQVIASEAILGGSYVSTGYGLYGREFFVHRLSPLAHNLTLGYSPAKVAVANYSVCDRVTDANSSGGDLRLLSRQNASAQAELSASCVRARSLLFATAGAGSDPSPPLS